MANPNKTVGNWRRKHGFAPKPPREFDAFMAWVFDQSAQGKSFPTSEAALAEFNASTKTTDQE